MSTMPPRTKAGLAALLLAVGTDLPRASAQSTAQGAAEPMGGLVQERGVGASLAAEAGVARIRDRLR